jgi:hypothetical protein
MFASMLRATSSESGISDGMIAKSVTLAGDIGGDRPDNFTRFVGRLVRSQSTLPHRPLRTPKSLSSPPYPACRPGTKHPLDHRTNRIALPTAPRRTIPRPIPSTRNSRINSTRNRTPQLGHARQRQSNDRQNNEHHYRHRPQTPRKPLSQTRRH